MELREKEDITIRKVMSKRTKVYVPGLTENPPREEDDDMLLKRFNENSDDMNVTSHKSPQFNSINFGAVEEEEKD